MKNDSLQENANLPPNPTESVKWIEDQVVNSHKEHASALFGQFLEEASQPKSLSGNACVKLCGFVEQASKASSEQLQEWAFSQHVALGLFNFYMEWNESDHHRSMKLVLDVAVQLLKRNPCQEKSREVKANLLDTLISIVIGRSTKPVARSAIKMLEHFLTKGLFTLDEIKVIYLSYRKELENEEEIQIWRLFVADIFHWMRLHFVCPTAGKFIVCLYRFLRQREKQGYSVSPDIITWFNWLLDFVSEEPTVLESIKNYIFLPFFTADRHEALRFIRVINTLKTELVTNNHDMGAPTLLFLAALETGKKVGLVEEPDLEGEEVSSVGNSSILVQEHILEGVLSHPSQDVRSLAFSLLITSPSTIRPYSPTALGLLKKHIGTFFADSDAKFRVDVLSKSRDMFKRVRGAIHVLKRSIPRARAKALKAKAPSAGNTTQPVTYRSNLITLPEAYLTSCLEYHEEFLQWYLNFLRGELSPTVSYQRHIASLKAIMFILRIESQDSKTWETLDDQQLFYDVFDDRWMRALFDLIMDPFEDVRDISAAVIKSLFSDVRYRKFSLLSEGKDDRSAEELSELSRRADKLARQTARADHSDGAAKACQLLYTFLGAGEPRLLFLSRLVNELDLKISSAENDLGRAVLEAPLHGNFASLCFTWRVVSNLKFTESELEPILALQEVLVACCERIWHAVKDILCDDSPEGHLPQELEELEGLNTKDLLSYSFRAIHESSNLMRAMASTIRSGSKEGFVSPSQELFERIGNLTFTQLSSLRHRGAFTTVSSTFAACCQQSKYLNPTTGGLTILDVWYEGTMSEIFSQASTTRRSAGIPSLMTGILSANAPKPSFENVVQELMDIASMEARVSETDGSNLPQVHAYNCLKDIFKSSLLASLGNQSEKYLPECLELAAGGLKSEVWAVRNCGLIFLRSLIDCLFGSHETKSMIEAGWDGKANRIPYHRYPNLPTVLMNLLKSGHQMVAHSATNTTAAESVFPALDIVRRAGPPDVLREEIQVHIAKYLSSPVWHVREIASRTLCSCLLHEKWLDVVKGIFQDAFCNAGPNGQNHVHGVLLTLKFVIERLKDVDSERLTIHLPELISFLKGHHIDAKYSDCPEILAAYLEVINMIWSVQQSNSSPLGSFTLSLPSVSGSALLKTQKAIYSMYVVSQNEDPIKQLRNLLLDPGFGVNTLVSALEMLPILWPLAHTPNSLLSDFCGLYVAVCTENGFPESQAVAVQNLAEILDQLLSQGELDLIPVKTLVSLWTSLPLSPMNPTLSNAVVRISGCIVASSKSWSGDNVQGLRSWGAMVADAGLDHQTFDTRFAAAESLRSFFAATKDTYTSEAYLPILIALYDALNDDDDEVRDLASIAAEAILGQAIVPIEAAHRLLEWLTSHFADSPIFRGVIASRIIGHYEPESGGRPWESAGAQLASALDFDDSLFVIEDQNLFIDEVRETSRWIVALESIGWKSTNEISTRLDSWLYEGLGSLRQLIEMEDGPLGWASNPRVYAICDSILRGSAAVVKHGDPSRQLRDAVSSCREVMARSRGNHVSRLLTDGWDDNI